MVFTTQGGCETHAEAILAQIAAAIARAEDTDAVAIKAELLEAISVSIARSVAKAISRRRRKHGARPSPTARLMAEIAALDTADEDD